MRSSLVLLSLLLLSQSSWSASVDLEWEYREGAKEYQIEVRRDETVIMSLSSATQQFRINLPVGKYQLRGRVITKYNMMGNWSDYSAFEVPPPVLALDEPLDHGGIINPKTLKARVQLTWPSVEEAEFYRVFILDDKNQLIKTLETKDPESELQLSPGAYTYQVQAIGRDGVEGERSQNLGAINIEKGKLPRPVLRPKKNDRHSFVWTSLADTKWHFQLFYKPYFGEEWFEMPRVPEVDGSAGSWSPASIVKKGAGLRPGFYELSFFISASGFENSPINRIEFEIKPTRSQLKADAIYGQSK